MTHRRSRNRYNRRGLAIAEWFCILGLVAAALFLFISTFGDSLSGDINSTADGLGEPSKLLKQIGDRAEKIRKARGPNGNNGVGNGEDPPPPGNAPINDGPGTGPGNPGNRGGAKK